MAGFQEKLIVDKCKVISRPWICDKGENGTVRMENGTVRMENGTVRMENGTVRMENGTVRMENGTVCMTQRYQIKEQIQYYTIAPPFSGGAKQDLLHKENGIETAFSQSLLADLPETNNKGRFSRKNY